MNAEIDKFNIKYNSKNIFLSLYESNELVYPEGISVENQNERFLGTISDEASSHTVILDNYAFISKRIGNYTAVITGVEYTPDNSDMKNKGTIIKLGVFLFFLVIVIIAITNYFLTKYIVKSITGPLGILSGGVNLIQQGNLDYRIDYASQDEFSIVCADFNLMAQKLRESVELREKDEANRKELIAGISHDLRTPLTSIKAYVEGLLDGIAATPEMQRNYLETIRAKAENIDQTVDKLFTFSKLDMGEYPFYPEILDIGEELAKFSEATFGEYESKGLILKIAGNIRNSYVKVDPLQFRNVLTNILENSVKYRDKETGTIEAVCFRQGEDVCITFADDGPGVPEEALGKLFEIFYRGDASRNNPSKGSGLGLAISAKIIEMSGGHIRAENIPEGGLKIIITLPVVKGGKAIEKYSDNRG
jgi:signal transduction histidine kinase